MSNRQDKTNPRHIKPPKAAFLSGSGGLSLAKTKESPPGDTAERGRSTNNPRKRSGATRRRAKKTAPQSRKVHGIPTSICRTAKIKLIPGKHTHPKRLSFRGLGGFLWPRTKKASQESRNPSGLHHPGGVAAPRLTAGMSICYNTPQPPGFAVPLGRSRNGRRRFLRIGGGCEHVP